nr:helix-turn-helix transcriptional regulator [Mycobacteroides chelonae]
MVDMLLEYRDCFSISSAEIVEDMIAAANSIPEGAPVGTIARRPDGAWIANRLMGNSWDYRRLLGDEEHPGRYDADSWPVIYDPTKPGTPRREYALCIPHPSGPIPHYDTISAHPSQLEGRVKDQPDEAVYGRLVYEWEPVDLTAQQEPDRFPGIENPSTSDYIGAAVADEQLKMVFALRDIRKQRGMEVDDVAEAADVLASEVSMFESGSSNPTLSLVRRYAKAVEAVFTVDVRKWEDTPAQQEPEACESCLGSGLGLGAVLGGFLETDCSDCDATGEAQREPKPRTPRVVDRLGVDEQGSRWRCEGGHVEYWFAGGRWRDGTGHDYQQGYEPHIAGPYTEVLDS